MDSLHPLIAHSRSHIIVQSRLNAGQVRRAVASVEGFNAKTAVFVPAVLGSMPFFWFCLVLTLCSLPAVLTAFFSEVVNSSLLADFFPAIILKVSLISLVAWVAQTFIQLVALPVLQVSGNAQMAQQEAHTAVILDRLDEETAGGVGTVLAAIHELREEITKPINTKKSAVRESKK